jgi:predicted xylose isomerase-like sugar epimerase
MISSLHDATVSDRSTNRHHVGSIRNRRPEAIFRSRADNFHHTLNRETIIARALKYTVSHFIDCDAVARTLCVSPLNSSRAAKSNQRDEHEYSQT